MKEVTNWVSGMCMGLPSILDAAVQLVGERPDAGLEAIAAAGVMRQTVYTHYPSREQLLAAVVDRVTEEVVAAMDAAEPDAGTAVDALLRCWTPACGLPSGIRACLTPRRPVRTAMRGIFRLLNG